MPTENTTGTLSRQQSRELRHILKWQLLTTGWQDYPGALRQVQGIAAAPSVSPSRIDAQRVSGAIPTQDIINTYDAELVHAGRKPSSMKTYRKVWNAFADAFPVLPTERAVILGYLSQFDGDSGRNRMKHQDTIHYLYKHALALGRLESDPMEGMKRPKVREQQPNPLTLAQVGRLMVVDMTDRERAAMHLLVGHGWRQNELLELTAGDVRRVHDGLIWCRGKQRDEDAPVLPETVALLLDLVEGKADDAQVFQGIRGREERFTYEGMSRLVKTVMARAGLAGFTGHNLRDTFATLVTEASGDLTLAMQLIRDKVPGVASRYVKRDLPEQLALYSPLRLLCACQDRGEAGERTGIVVETGESRTPASANPDLVALADAMRALADTADALRRLAASLSMNLHGYSGTHGGSEDALGRRVLELGPEPDLHRAAEFFDFLAIREAGS